MFRPAQARGVPEYYDMFFQEVEESILKKKNVFVLDTTIPPPVAKAQGDFAESSVFFFRII